MSRLVGFSVTNIQKSSSWVNVCMTATLQHITGILSDVFLSAHIPWSNTVCQILADTQECQTCILVPPVTAVLCNPHCKTCFWPRVCFPNLQGFLSDFFFFWFLYFCLCFWITEFYLLMCGYPLYNLDTDLFYIHYFCIVLFWILRQPMIFF